MSLCDSCHIEEKLFQCCGRYPMTCATVCLELPGGVTVTACPWLGADGRCRSYERRPEGCRRFFCERYSTEGRWGSDLE